jgi:hypothetical protein
LFSCSSLPSWLTMRPSGVKKVRSSKPVRDWHIRRIEIADLLSSDPDNEAMVSCTECINHDVVCYYDREQSVSCAECLRHQRKCDGTFSVEEFRKVGEQKKQLISKSRLKRREIARLRKTLAALEESDADIQDSLAALEDKSSRMLRREMQALGAFDNITTSSGTSHEVALAEPEFVFDGQFVTDSVDWEQVLGLSGGTEQPALG